MQATARQPQKFDFPEVDRPGALLFLASMQELRDKGLIYTGSIVSLLWHAIFVLEEINQHQVREGDCVLRTADAKFWRITNKPKMSNGSLQWLATVHPQDFLYTLLCSVDAGAQKKITEGWLRNPNEKPQIIAGLKKWQGEFRDLLAVLQQRGLLKFQPQLLKGAA